MFLFLDHCNPTTLVLSNLTSPSPALARCSRSIHNKVARWMKLFLKTALIYLQLL